MFLLPVRSWVRKGIEAWLTVLVEALWPKKRILTAYLNVVDWGHGNFGAEAAAETYFGVDASELTQAQAARLAAVLPDPEVKADKPGRYVRRRTGTVVSRLIRWCAKPGLVREVAAGATVTRLHRKCADLIHLTLSPASRLARLMVGEKRLSSIR